MLGELLRTFLGDCIIIFNSKEQETQAHLSIDEPSCSVLLCDVNKSEDLALLFVVRWR